VADTQSDSGSFEELAMPLFASLYNFAHWLTKDRNEAEDLVQEAFMKALKGFSSYRQGSNFRAWIYRILRNTFLTTRSGLQASTVSLDGDEGPSVEPIARETPESILISNMGQHAIQAALEELPVQYREVILLCDVDEMSYQEIAEILSIPIGTVMSRLSRGRKAMRELLRGPSVATGRGVTQ
jgi:RNA polymerase sigma-70 factor (ECF subfamily)